MKEINYAVECDCQQCDEIVPWDQFRDINEYTIMNICLKCEGHNAKIERERRNGRRRLKKS